MDRLSASVGLGGSNHGHDVRAVQRLLLAHGSSPGVIDGRFGRITLGAIVRYQRRFLREPDGRVDLNGPTWRHLNNAQRQEGGRAGPATSAASAATTAGPRNGPRPARIARPTPPDAATAAPPPGSARSGEVRYTDHLPLPAPHSVNIGISSPSNALLKSTLGTPRSGFTDQCQPPTDPRLIKAVVTESVGPFRVTGLRPAVASLRAIFDEVRRDHPDLHGKLGTAGMMCCRLVRGSGTSISNHSWGTAIDMKIDGALVPWRANHALVGLAMIVPYFNRHGWFWGGGYRKSKDAHHFECGSDLISSFNI